MGSLKFAIGLEPPSLRIEPAAFTISFRFPYCPRAAGSESLKCFHFSFFGRFFLRSFLVRISLLQESLFNGTFSYLLLGEPSFSVKGLFGRSFWLNRLLCKKFTLPTGSWEEPYFLKNLKNLL